jgi:short-subunit dehydrogenase
MPNRMRIDSQAAIVTGASSGIGAALARALAQAGVKVGLTARRASELETLAESIRAQGGIAEVAAADAADRAATHAAIAKLEEGLGATDLLIANAGVGVSTPAVEFSSEAIERMMRVNVFGVCYAIEAVLPGMLARGRGHLVGVSSLAAYRGLYGQSGYGASKAALSTLLESLRVELRLRGIAVTTVHPGYVRTPMTAGADHWQPFIMEPEAAARIIVRGIAAKRREVNFPWSMAGLMGLIRHLPNPIYDRLNALLARPGTKGTPPTQG